MGAAAAAVRLRNRLAGGVVTILADGHEQRARTAAHPCPACETRCIAVDIITSARNQGRGTRRGTVRSCSPPPPARVDHGGRTRANAPVAAPAAERVEHLAARGRTEPRPFLPRRPETTARTPHAAVCGAGTRGFNSGAAAPSRSISDAGDHRGQATHASAVARGCDAPPTSAGAHPRRVQQGIAERRAHLRDSFVASSPRTSELPPVVE